MKIFEKWLSFFWTLVWFAALAALCAYQIFRLTEHHNMDLKTIAVAAISGGYACFLIKPLIQKGRALRDDDGSAETVFNQSEPAPYERRFFCLYQKICNQRIMCVVLFAILIGIPFFLLGSYTYSTYHPGKEWAMKQALYGLVSLAPCMVLLYKIIVAKKRNLRLLEEVYGTSGFSEIQIIDNIVKKEPTYVFTQNYFLNWDSNLNIVSLKEIETIRYVPYFYLFWYGTKLVIKEHNGKKHTIWFDGPEGDAWKPDFQIKDAGTHAKVESNVNVN